MPRCATHLDRAPTAVAALPPVVPAAVAEAARVARHTGCGRLRTRGPARGLRRRRRRVWPALCLRLDLLSEVLHVQNNSTSQVLPRMCLRRCGMVSHLPTPRSLLKIAASHVSLSGFISSLALCSDKVLQHLEPCDLSGLTFFSHVSAQVKPKAGRN